MAIVGSAVIGFIAAATMWARRRWYLGKYERLLW